MEEVRGGPDLIGDADPAVLFCFVSVILAGHILSWGATTGGES